MTGNTVLVIVLAIVSTAVLSVIQGLYWTWVAKNDREHAELLRRLGSAGNDSYEESLFREQESDGTADALGSVGSKLQTVLMSAESSLSVGELLVRMAALGAVGIIGGGLFAGILGMSLAIPLAAGPYVYLKYIGQARAKLLTAQLPDSLELMSRSLQAGLGLNDAFRLVAEEMPMPIQGEFLQIFEEVRFGRDYRDALNGMLDRNPSVFDLRLMVSSVLLQRETGGNLIEILENIAETVRARFVFHAKVRAMTSEARFTALILGGLPLAVLGILVVSNPDYVSPLFDDPKGNILLACDMILYSMGVFIMRDMANVEV